MMKHRKLLLAALEWLDKKTPTVTKYLVAAMETERISVLVLGTKAIVLVGDEPLLQEDVLVFKEIV
jgi:hypothetical protein